MSCRTARVLVMMMQMIEGLFHCEHK